MRDGLGTREMVRPRIQVILILYLMRVQTTLMPSGHAFFSIDHFITSTGKDILEDLLDKASKRNPDLYDMYIYEGKLCTASPYIDWAIQFQIFMHMVC